MVPWKSGLKSDQKLRMQLNRYHHLSPVMPDPGDNYNGPAGRSRVGGPTTATLTLPDLPRELIHRVASFLEVRDLLALRTVGFNLDRLKPPQAYQVQIEPQIHLQPDSGQTPLEGFTSRPPAAITTGSEVLFPG